MIDKKTDLIETHYAEDRLATEKDLKILKLELLNEMHREITSVKSYLLTRLGSMLVGGFTILGMVGWFK
jgi:hypothetical protein